MKILSEKQSVFIEYLLSHIQNGKTKLPAISKIGEELGISIPNLREQIELARNLGFINVKPRTGISILPYDFTPAVTKSLYYAVKSNASYFEQYSDLRNQIEKAYFLEAVSGLEKSDISKIFQIVESAKKKLNGRLVQIPHAEHRAYHLSIYKNLNNIFIEGLLTSYWNMYELVGLDTYADLDYLKNVWEYHENIIEEIANRKSSKAFVLLTEHIELLYNRS